MKKIVKKKKEEKATFNLKVIVCRYCHKKITSPGLVGITLVCPYCKRPVNGQYRPD